MGFETVVATGGVASGLDVARAIALGASAAGIARPVLKALRGGGQRGGPREQASGREDAMALLEGVENELRAVMLLTGSRDLVALRRTPRVVVGELAAWLAELGGESPSQR
jgi:isopentenyl-diphosphate delta-isomerase